MTGRTYIFAEEVYKNGLLVEYNEYEDGFRFASRHSCEAVSINFTKDTQNGSNIYCVDVCMCKLYRKKIVEKIKLQEYNRARILLFAGLERMKRDIKVQGIIPWLKNLIGF